MSETPTFLAERLEAEGAKSLDFFSSLADEQWQTEVYTEGTTWSVRNVLAHFVMAEKSFIVLFANIQQSGSGVPEDFDIDRHNARRQKEAAALSPRELIDQFKTVRAQMVSWVAALNADDLEKRGRHPFFGMTTLAEMIKMVYRHNQIHLRDVRRTLPTKTEH